MEKMASDSDILIDGDAILTVRIKLKAPNAKVLTYGSLKIAEEEASKFFLMEELRARKIQQEMGLIKFPPNGGKPN